MSAENKSAVNGRGQYPCLRIIESPLVFGRTIIAAPSELHVKAVQQVLLGNLDQSEPISYEAFKANPEAYADRIGAPLFIISDGTDGDLLKKLDGNETFWAYDILIVRGDKVMSYCDRTGYQWGSAAKGISSEAVFANYPMILADMTKE